MDLKEYLDTSYTLNNNQSIDSQRITAFVNSFDSGLNISSYEIFILGVPEGRNSLENEGCSLAPDEIRKSFYALFSGDWHFSVLDLGNLKVGETFQDTYQALTDISAYFIKMKKVLLVLGGGHDLIMPIFNGHSVLNKPLNFASVDACLDFQNQGKWNSKSFLSPMLSSHDTLLAKYSLIGYQTYLSSQKEIELMNQMHFNMIRLGDVNADLSDLEPYIRELHHLSIDLCSLKISESPGNPYSGPNGISAESLCSIMRYAGMSSSIQTILLSELNRFLDLNCQSARIYAQSLWYFLEGFELRNNDSFFLQKENFLIFHIQSSLAELVFYKSKSSSRWWVGLPVEPKSKVNPIHPCSFSDYKKAVKGNLSKRLLKYLKL
jgi:arginase family enzyme